MTEWLNGRFVCFHSLDALRRSADWVGYLEHFKSAYAGEVGWACQVSLCRCGRVGMPRHPMPLGWPGCGILVPKRFSFITRTSRRLRSSRSERFAPFCALFIFDLKRFSFITRRSRRPRSSRSERSAPFCTLFIFDPKTSFLHNSTLKASQKLSIGAFCTILSALHFRSEAFSEEIVLLRVTCRSRSLKSS